MREKIARGMAEKNGHQWDGIDPTLREWLMSMADAALAALETPTDAMLRAGCEHLTIQGTWRSMIRAAGE